MYINSKSGICPRVSKSKKKVLIWISLMTPWVHDTITQEHLNTYPSRIFIHLCVFLFSFPLISSQLKPALFLSRMAVGVILRALRLRKPCFSLLETTTTRFVSFSFHIYTFFFLRSLNYFQVIDLNLYLRFLRIRNFCHFWTSILFYMYCLVNYLLIDLDHLCLGMVWSLDIV